MGLTKEVQYSLQVLTIGEVQELNRSGSEQILSRPLLFVQADRDPIEDPHPEDQALNQQASYRLEEK